MSSKDILDFIGAFAAGLVCLGAVAWFLKWVHHVGRENRAHAREMAMIQAGKAAPDTAEMEKIHERCDSLEKRCAKLEEQLKDAHLLLADEQRALDKKLASIIPDEATGSRERSSAPSKTVM